MNVAVLKGQATVTDSVEICNSFTEFNTTERCDVLNVVSIGAPPAWLYNKFTIPRQLFEDRGVKVGFACLSDDNLEAWLAVIEQAQPKVVIVRAIIASEVVSEVLANRYPTIQFVHICHSSLGYAANMPAWVVRQLKLIELSIRCKNVWYAHPDEEEAGAFGTVYPEANVAWLPNVVRSRKNLRGDRKLTEHVRLFLPCAWRPMKNILGQIHAVALAAVRSRHEFSVVLSMPGVGRDSCIPDTIELLRRGLKGIRVSSTTWQDTSEYIMWMHCNAHIVLQCSYSESFNYVAWEAMDIGLPVLTSPAISFGSVSANPDSIKNMSRRILDICEDYGRHCVTAVKEADAVRERFNEQVIKVIEHLLEA